MAGQIHAVIGSDEGTVSEKAHVLFEKLKPEGGDEFANDIVEGQADDSEGAFQICSQAVQSLQTLPFFGGAKVVWLKGANFLGDDRTGGSERSKEGVEMLLGELKAGVADDVIFILSASAIDKRRSFYKWLQSHAKLSVYDKIDTSKDGWEEQVMHEVQKRAKTLNLGFEREAMDLFVMLAGEDTRQIASELEKLDLYLGADRREVTLEDVRLMVPLSRAGVVWEISRALENQDGARALRLIDEQLESGDSAIGIMRASVIPTVRSLFMARAVIEGRKLPTGNYRSFEAGLKALPARVRAGLPQKKAGGVNAYPLFLAAQKASRFSLPELSRALESCLKADEALVTTALDHRMVLHRFVAELVSGGAKKKKKSPRQMARR